MVLVEPVRLFRVPDPFPRVYVVGGARVGRLLDLGAADRNGAYDEIPGRMCCRRLDDRLAPDFARTVDIHRKPGYDPVELFIDPALPLMHVNWHEAQAWCRFAHRRLPSEARCCGRGRLMAARRFSASAGGGPLRTAASTA